MPRKMRGAYDRFLIAPFKTGLVTDVPAWQVPEDAYLELNNAYIKDGAVRKRFGTTLMGGSVATNMLDQLNSRLRIYLGKTDGAGAAAGTVPGATFAVGQIFSIAGEIFTVTTAGLQDMLTTGAATTCTYNTATGAYVFDFSSMEEEFWKVVSGKYSTLNPSNKEKIRQFFKTSVHHAAYIESYITPKNYYGMYSEILGVPIKHFKKCGELCEKPDLVAEKLIISTKVMKSENIILNLPSSNQQN